MRAHERALVQQLYDGLQRCESGLVPLPGIAQKIRKDVYVQQLVDSIRRVRFVPTITTRDIHPDRANGLSPMFDPVKAAVLHQRSGNIDEACWLIFIFVHFGKHAKSGYRYAREVYSALGMRPPWTFVNTRADITGFRAWLDKNEKILTRGTGRGFGNHRKYQSLSATKPNGTGDAFESYINWINSNVDHSTMIQAAVTQAAGDATAAFNSLYRSMQAVSSFGRTARFDYLTMLGKLGLATIRPGSAYFSAATGPVDGARLMLQGNFNKSASVSELDKKVGILAQQLGVGMQEMEDSLCNWQKSPDKYIRFSA